MSVYGKSGCGKSTVVRFVCENLDDVEYCFVNLRKAKTVFGCANLVLSELGEPNVKNAHGIHVVFEKIGNAIENILGQLHGKKLFVLVLDELDSVFLDKRGKPSDFIYNFVMIEEYLREKNLMMCIVGISNNLMSEFDLDDRVRSRIGSSEVFFEAYSDKDVLEILNDRANNAFSNKVDPSVLQHCASLSSSEHGDARRAVDLLRTAAEIASKKSESLSKSHVDSASEQLQKNRIDLILSTASYHLKIVAMSIARITFLSDDAWHSTSSLYKQYGMILDEDTKPLTYRRVSELLVELQNTGIVLSKTASKGRHGYGTQYKLAVTPESVGIVISSEWWNNLKKRKAKFEAGASRQKFWDSFGLNRGPSSMQKRNKEIQKSNWRKFSGLES